MPKRAAWIFVVAVFLPSLVLGWLAVRTARDQGIIIERQAAELLQRDADGMAAVAREVVVARQASFLEAVNRLVAEKGIAEVSAKFDQFLPEAWPEGKIGFAVSLKGDVIAPAPGLKASNTYADDFIKENNLFLTNKALEKVYEVPSPQQNGGMLNTAAGENAGTKAALGGSNTHGDESRQSFAMFGNTIGTRKAGLSQGESVLAKEGSVQAPQSGLDFESTGSTSTTIEQNAPARRAASEVGLKPASAPAAETSAAAPETSPPLPLEQENKAKKQAYSAAKQDTRQAGVFGSVGGNLEGEGRLEDSKKTAFADKAEETNQPRLDGVMEQKPQTAEKLEMGSAPVDSFKAEKDAAAAPPVTKGNKAADMPEEAPSADAGLASGTITLSGSDDLVRRRVAPQKNMKQREEAPVSQLVGNVSNFARVAGQAQDGIVTRFVQDRLEMLFWVRPAANPDVVLGVVVPIESFRPLWAEALKLAQAGNGAEVCFTLLDEKAQPVWLSKPGFKSDWKHPFVASEIGEMLPYWEASIYYLDPASLGRSARLVTWTLLMLIALALGAIAFGGFLVMLDTRRQLELARKKTDFVSNVSHELKTPLTSIRMFAELLSGDRVDEPEKRKQYLRIITLESERLTRLINNVLDFARLERGKKRYNRQRTDLYPALERLWESQSMHLQDHGFESAWHAAPGPYWVEADEDAVIQVVVNLLSNAEKYSGERKSVELHSYLNGGSLCIGVLDRGTGVPAGEEQKIFEEFYRAHDSLASAVPGSGLGLTLAARIASDHGGKITLEHREGGGSNFTLWLPLAAPDNEA
jgi:signal transduction histidine kinase